MSEFSSNITVVGLGKIGLPLAAQFSSRGFKVFGADISESTVEFVNAGKVPFPGEPGLEKLLEASVLAGNLSASTRTTDCVKKSGTVLVVVPVYADLNGDPDFSLIDRAVEDIAVGLNPGTLVIFETTLPVGTTRNRFTTMLGSISGLEAGEEFFVAYSPERVYSGRIFSDLKKYPKLVGGVDSKSGALAAAFYNKVLDFEPRPELGKPNGVWDLGSSEASELAKLAETTYRDVNIALANQFAKYADSIDVNIYKVIEACNSQPFSHIHSPGIAVGGHCIPIYPQLYLKGDPHASIVREARNLNAGMPEYAVSKLKEHLESLDGKTVAVLGASYRGGVKELAFSGVFPMSKLLAEEGASVLVHDPLFTEIELLKKGFKPYRFGEAVDAVILQANHEEYKLLSSEMFPGARVFFDGRNFAEFKEPGALKIMSIGALPKQP